MLRLSTSMKLRTYIFIPPMGRLDSDILESIVKITNSKNQTFDITVSEYLLNSRGLAPGMASDGLYYSEVITGDLDTDIFRSLSTKYIPAGASYSTDQPAIYITADSNQSSFRIVAFDDKTKSMSEEAIKQAINANDQGYTVRGILNNIRSLLGSKIITLQDGSELIWKPPFSFGFIRMESIDGTTVVKPANTGKDFLFWELVDRNVPDCDIVDLLTNHLNISDRLTDLESEIGKVSEKAQDVANSIEALTYQLDSTKTTINFLATKIAEQKAQISSVQSSVSSSALSISNAIDHVDKEQGSNYIKLEDLSKSVQGLNYAMSQLTVLPIKMENSLGMNEETIQALSDIKIVLNRLNQIPQQEDSNKGDKLLTSVTIINLLLQIIDLIPRKGGKNE